MKYLYSFLILCLLQTNAFTQNSDLSCPKVEWMKQITIKNSTHYINIDVKKNNKIVIGCSFIDTLNVDNFIINNNNGRIAMATMEGDSDGNILWLKTSNGNGRSAYQHLNKNIATEENKINIISMYNQTATFNNQNYNSTITNQPNQSLQENSDFSLIKLDSNNQTINNFSVQNLKLQNVITDSLGYTYVIANYRNSVIIANQTYTPLGQHDAIVIKLNSQYQVQWVLPIRGKGNEEFVNITLDKNLNVYVAGHFNSDTLQIGNEIIIDTARRNNSSYTGYNILFSKISNNGILQWAKHTHATRNSSARAQHLVVDSNNNVYILANLTGSLILNNSNFESSRNSNNSSYLQNTILLKYKPSTNIFHSKILNGTNHNNGYAMIWHKFDNKIYVVGQYSDTIYTSIGNYFTNKNSTRGYLCRIKVDLEKMDIDYFTHIENDSNIIYSIASGYGGAIYIAGINYNNIKFLNKNLVNNNNYDNHFYAKISGLNKEITYDGSMYTATETQASTYQWLDCTNNMQAIPGATSRTFTPDQTGSYAVELSNGTCQVVSECLGTTSLPKTILAQTQIFPNPFDQSISIQVPPTLAQQELHLQVTDLLGRTIWSHKGNAKELNTQLQEKSKLWPSNQMYHCTITLTKTQERKSIKIYKQ